MAEKLLTEDEQKAVNALQFKDLFRFAKKEIDDVFKNASFKAGEQGLRLLQTEAKSPLGKILIITPRRSGPAVKRNLFKRRVKAIFYENKLYLKPVISVLIAGRRGTNLSFDELKNFLIGKL